MAANRDEPRLTTAFYGLSVGTPVEPNLTFELMHLII